MRRVLFTLLVLLVPAIIRPDLAVAKALPQENSLINHELRVFLDPEGRRFTAEDTITVPESWQRTLHFSLHKGLKPVSLSPNVTAVRESGRRQGVPIESYRVSLPASTRTFVLKFGGEIYHPVSPSGQEVARGMRDTPGIISKEGVFLSGGSHWYPQFGEGLITFTLEVNLPQDWDVVSQGARTSHQVEGGAKLVTWRCEYPQEEIFVVAARFFQFSRAAGDVESMVFLREDDQNMADKYLTAAARYLDVYEKMIGPYAYKKFALVENFWETGYGMPSFTLMGPKVIRFPFIVDSSYPHEILHNWWGNGVFPDPRSGNWSEGLTAYLSDHLMQEQRGTTYQYRRDTLQKFADYVSREKDFALTRFRSRHSAATEAIGYGKALMFFHMLRTELGDEAFVEGLRGFYHNNKFKFASFDDIRKSFETVSGKDLSRSFGQWVDKPGAPQLKISNPRVTTQGEGYLATVLFEQAQAGAPYYLNIPVAITMEGQDHAYQTVVRMTKRRHEAEFRLPLLPLRIDVDPEFDLFRRLAPEEIPPALSQVFGAKKLTIVLPSSASDTLINAFQELAQAWRESGPDEVKVVSDSEMHTLPSDASVVILGWENRFLSEMFPQLAKYGVRVEHDSLTIGENRVPKMGHSTAMTVRHPKNNKLALTWVASDRAEAIRGLARKLPHYHNYSYLVFEGDKALNAVKGYWPVLRSPMSVFFPGTNGSILKAPMGKLEPRKPLARFP